MRYALTQVSDTGRRLFKDDQVYDDRDIVRLAKKASFCVTRPNGNQRIRGSSRLLVKDGGRTVAKFERFRRVKNDIESPVPVAVIRGRLI